MAKLSEIEGIGSTYARKLKAAGVSTTNSLLAKCATPKGRKAVASSAGISEKLVLEWTNHADLFRIKGVGQEYADLLEASGVDSVPELRQRSASALHAKMSSVNRSKKLIRQMPSEKQVSKWIGQAKKLPRVIKY